MRGRAIISVATSVRFFSPDETPRISSSPTGVFWALVSLSPAITSSTRCMRSSLVELRGIRHSAANMSVSRTVIVGM